jgi:hypothetical protein
VKGWLLNRHQQYEVGTEIELGRLEGSAMGSAVRLCKIWSKYHVLQKEAISGDFGHLNIVKYAAFRPK